MLNFNDKINKFYKEWTNDLNTLNVKLQFNNLDLVQILIQNLNTLNVKLQSGVKIKMAYRNGFKYIKC